MTGIPTIERRHRMKLALEYGDVSISAMADELHLSRNTISNYIHGRTEPRHADLVLWAARCNVPLDWLLNGPNVMAPGKYRGSR